jgi:hypothetical protein
MWATVRPKTADKPLFGNPQYFNVTQKTLILIFNTDTCMFLTIHNTSLAHKSLKILIFNICMFV